MINMIEKELENKLITWLKLENEVMTKVNKRFKANKINRNEWNSYFIDKVKEYGNKDMLEVIKVFKRLQDVLLKEMV